MRHRSTQILLLSFILICGCRGKTPVDTKPDEIQIMDTVVITKEPGNKIDFDKVKVIRNVFVTNRDGASYMEEMDENVKTIGTYPYGEKLEVIEEIGEWYGVRDRLTRKFTRNGVNIESSGWEKVYVLKRQVGDIEQVKLVPSDLYSIVSTTTNLKTQNFENGHRLSGYLNIELIDETLFDKALANEVNFLITDTNEVKKKNGTILLKCTNKIVKFTDRPNAEEQRQEFQYLGQFDFLNSFLVSGNYYESSDFKFIDKTTGHEKQSLVDYPNVSADRKYIICIYANPYDSTADLELYSINDTEIKHVMSSSFKNWMPNGGKKRMFFSNDNCLYVPVNHVSSYWDAKGNLNESCQYLRIKVL